MILEYGALRSNGNVASEWDVNCSLPGDPEKRLGIYDDQFWIYIGVYVGLVLIAGLMSGLTMGLLSLDTTTLMVLRDAGTEKEKKYAARILPLVSRHHMLLVTLLLANAAAVEAMPIFLDRVSDPITAVAVSVTAVLLFGEVVPQAVCTRYGLAIGATLAPLVYFLMGILIIIVWPLSKVLDCLLGEEHGTFYRRAELKVLVDLHGKNHHVSRAQSSDGADDCLTVDEIMIIKGALDMKYKTVANAMVPIQKVFMLSCDNILDDKTITKILNIGHSRIPVYAGECSNVIGLLLTKTLIGLNRAHTFRVQDLLGSIVCRPAMFVDDTMPLFDLLNEFQTGRSHLAMVRKTVPVVAEDLTVSEKAPLLMAEEQPLQVDTVQEIVGIITLEDVIEQLLQEEITDETDVIPFQEVGSALQITMAKAVNRHRTTKGLLRSKSQPNTSFVNNHTSPHLSASQPQFF
ncbi:LOW QUALITY PROTEIN: DUF21 domain-containing protein At2g14520-like [Pomacea canaliculata]|uniref:LOW QUALITY PROTEIN: DUF21 domain-containing protein At2g14520-like n=1 Tax=Pomacea canaliculata TaxID=400727 RepID=UPI000D73EFA7|nr:LOW QUALITY PROTEIN: DUF21 domain-containing protein At2g14520-like [Pomacea canaliculata]